MRRIQTAEVKARKARSKKLVVGIVLVFLMVVSTAGYSLMQGDGDGEDSKVSERGIDFFKQNGLWVAEIDGRVFAFQYLPSEVANVSVKGFYDLGTYSNQLLYYVDVDEGTVEVLSNIGGYVLRYQGACLNESDCEDDFPMKDCSDNVFVTVAGNETEVYNVENCVYLVGDSVRAADAFLYKVLKV